MTNGETGGQTPETSGEIHKVTVKLPNFWSNSPSTWFVLAESQFALAKVTTQETKYNFVVASLPEDIAESITDLLEDPPTLNKYDKLREKLIDRHSLSMEARIKKLISGEDMGDKKPSDFYRTIQKLAGACGTVGGELLKKLWLSRMPTVISIALAPQKDEDIEKVLKVADAVWEAMQSANVSVMNYAGSPSMHSGNISSLQGSSLSSAPGNSFSVQSLQLEINELRKAIIDLKQSPSRGRSRSRSNFRSNSRSASPYRSTSNSRSNFNPSGNLCWYHFKFGNRASKCIQPCTFSSNNQNSSNSGN